MSREEIVNNIGYQLTRAALDYIEKHEFADGIDCFEAGAEWMQKKMIDKACECIIKLQDWSTHYAEFAKLQEEFITAFRKAMEE